MSEGPGQIDTLISVLLNICLNYQLMTFQTNNCHTKCGDAAGFLLSDKLITPIVDLHMLHCTYTQDELAEQMEEQFGCSNLIHQG